MKSYIVGLCLALGITVGSSVQADPIRIGWIGPLTGNNTFIGTDALEATKLAIEQVNAAGGIGGRSLELLVEDDAYLPKKSLTAYASLKDTRGVGLFMMYTYTGVVTVAPRALLDGTFIIDPVDCDNQIASLPESVVCLAKDTASLGKAIGTTACAKKERMAILFYDSDAFPREVAETARDAATACGAEVVAFEGYAPESADFKAELLRIKRVKADRVALISGDEVGLLVRQAREMGIAAPLVGIGSVLNPESQRIAGAENITGMQYPTWRAIRAKPFQDFEQAFQQRMGRAPVIEISTVPSYDAVFVLKQTLQAVLKAVGQDRFAAATGKELGKLVREEIAARGVHIAGASGAVGIERNGMGTGFEVVLESIK